MSHLCKVAGGHLKKRAGGHLANGCPSDCAACNATYTLITTNIGACTCSGDSTGFSAVRWYTASAGPNGTYTLSRVSGSVWESGLTGVTITQYSNSGCTTVVTTVGTFWRLTCSGTGVTKGWVLELITASPLADSMFTYSYGGSGNCAGFSTTSTGYALFCGRGLLFHGGSDTISVA